MTATNNPANPDDRSNPISQEETRMTTTQIAPPAATAAPAITKDIQQRVAAAIAEMRADILERDEMIHHMWVARVGQLHLLQLGPGGVGKSYSVRRMTQHIEGSIYFEKALDETTDPSEVFGPPNIKAMVEEGKTHRVTTGMFPEATDAFLDEFFNANGPLLHSIMPVLNERLFHNNGVPSLVPLRCAIMGTNKLNADADQAALWDRVHIREIVGDIVDRNNSISMVSAAISRMALVGRGTNTVLPGQALTTVTIEELDRAHIEALNLPVPDAVVDMFYDIRDELKQGKAQVRVSPRREVESMAAVLANAWVRGHEEVKVADLDILASMWWTVQDQRAEARSVILAATNPGEKAALDLLEELDKVKAEIALALKSDVDDTRKKRIGVEQVKNIDRLLAEANDHYAKASAAGTGTARIEETIAKANAVKQQIGKEIFGIDASATATLTNAAKV